MIAATPKNAFDKVKTHIQENKKVYIVGGVIVGGSAALAGAYILGTKTSPKEVENLVAPSIRQNAGLIWKSPPTIEVHIEALGDPGNIIQDLTTGKIYASQNQAAKAVGATASQISKHLAGQTNFVNGHEFVKLGKAMVSEPA
ncbi:hypothetical protein SEA_CONLEY_54 [Gordonia phage Conley]|nr:hypothetical protein SEA_CONLEY_54 [Gordonia phage Conley]